VVEMLETSRFMIGTRHDGFPLRPPLHRGVCFHTPTKPVPAARGRLEKHGKHA
jgi:hypothetical protein